MIFLTKCKKKKKKKIFKSLFLFTVQYTPFLCYTLLQMSFVYSVIILCECIIYKIACTEKKR